MLESIFTWPSHDEFLDRQDDLAQLDTWYSTGRQPLALYGRRRVGKSWLFRAFAHGKPALILVAGQVAEATSLRRFAQQLEPELGFRPELVDTPSLFRTLFRAARAKPLFVIIDEFPYLLPTGQEATKQLLQEVQAVIEEERAGSQLKLLLCGSYAAMKETLLDEAQPLGGSFDPLLISPLSLWDARPFLRNLEDAELIERFAVTGGMPLYLHELGVGSLQSAVTNHVVNPRGSLFNEPREILTEELREPKIYFSILAELAAGAKPANELADAVRRSTNEMSPYLDALRTMQLVDKRLPVTAAPTARTSQFLLLDSFFRFWFRFVFPYQDDLAAGLRPADHFRSVVKPQLADHVAPIFEQTCRSWTRSQYGSSVQRVGSWWGNSLHSLRRAGMRTSEEIDVVGIGPRGVAVIGECRWRREPMDVHVLDEVREFKLPAVRQSGARVDNDLQILLFARAGYTPKLKASAAESGNVRLVELSEVVGG